MNVRIRRARSIGLCAVVLSLLCGLLADPAAAATWPNEDAQRCDGDTLRRMSFVYDPTRCRSISHEMFASSGFRGFYGARGFDKNFMFWAPIESRWNAGSRSWATCNTHFWQPHPNGFCPSNGWITFAPVNSAIADGRITVKRWGNSFISTGCGNYSPNGGAGPVPRIRGAKYRDDNVNGRRDPGEPGLGGWRIRLRFNGNEVASTTTAADGSYEFRLNANSMPISSGTYSLTEDGQSGWIQTAAPSPFGIGFGAGDAIFGGKDFGNAPTESIASATAVSIGQSVAPGLLPAQVSFADSGSTGWTSSAQTNSSTHLTIPENPVATGHVLGSEISTGVGSASGEADIASLALTLPEGHTVSARSIHSYAHATCTAAEAGASVGTLVVDGQTIVDRGLPNQRFDLPGGVTVVLNEQAPTAGAQHGISVNAIHITIDGAADVVVAHAESGTRNCG